MLKTVSNSMLLCNNDSIIRNNSTKVQRKLLDLLILCCSTYSIMKERLLCVRFLPYAKHHGVYALFFFLLKIKNYSYAAYVWKGNNTTHACPVSQRT